MSAQRTERLLNLVQCLLAARRPMPRAELRAALAAYRDAPSDDAFERMFERDKEELRALGVPVTTVTSAEGEVLGYRVAAEDYALPDLNLTAAELAVLGLAAAVWEEPSLGAAAATGVRKLEAAAGGWAPGGGVAGRLAAGDDALPVLIDAVRLRRAVRFGYRRPDQDTPAERHLQPWAVLSWRGRWYVAGWDADRADTRVFRLSRVTSAVRPDGAQGGYDIPANFDPRTVLAGQPEPGPERTATVWAAAGAAYRLRTRATAVREATGPRAGDLLDVPYAETAWLAGELAALGASVVALAPPDLVAAVRDRLAGALAGAVGAP